jgi:hypothetical protein
MGVDAAGIADDPGIGVDRGGADEHADRLAGEGGGRQARILQRLPHQLQQQPLLRVHLLGLARRDPEGGGVEAVRVLDQPGGQGVAAARLALPGMVEPLDRPAVAADLRDAAAPLEQQRPEVVEAGRAGQPAGHADHRDGLVRKSRRACWHVGVLSTIRHGRAGSGPQRQPTVPQESKHETSNR